MLLAKNCVSGSWLSKKSSRSVPALAEERRWDDPGCLLVLGEEPRSTGCEPVRIVLGDLREAAACDVVDPGAAGVGLVADVLQQHNPAAVDRDVVEHLRSR